MKSSFVQPNGQPSRSRHRTASSTYANLLAVCWQHSRQKDNFLRTASSGRLTALWLATDTGRCWLTPFSPGDHIMPPFLALPSSNTQSIEPLMYAVPKSTIKHRVGGPVSIMFNRSSGLLASILKCKIFVLCCFSTCTCGWLTRVAQLTSECLETQVWQFLFD